MKSVILSAFLVALAASCQEPVVLQSRSESGPTNESTNRKEASEKMASKSESDEAGKSDKSAKSKAAGKKQIATFGAGCFWCVEAVLEQVPGILDVRSGYMGGAKANPTYKEICTGTTGHAEVVQVDFDSSKISYGDLLAWFWQLHDPTTLNRQGADVGTQYRSAIFYHSEEQKNDAIASMKQADASGEFDGKIVTEISAASTFYEAEGYHQDYYRLNRAQPYCRAVIAPKLDKLKLKK